LPTAATAAAYTPNPALRCCHVQAVCDLYCHGAAATAPAAHHLELGLFDLFDVGVVPYFPVMFTPPRSSSSSSAGCKSAAPHPTVTRELLLAKVVAAMAAAPGFASLGIPLLSEKLGSSLRCVHMYMYHTYTHICTSVTV
jgi:hypothetical protein